MKKALTLAAAIMALSANCAARDNQGNLEDRIEYVSSKDDTLLFNYVSEAMKNKTVKELAAMPKDKAYDLLWTKYFDSTDYSKEQLQAFSPRANNLGVPPESYIGFRKADELFDGKKQVDPLNAVIYTNAALGGNSQAVMEIIPGMTAPNWLSIVKTDSVMERYAKDLGLKPVRIGTTDYYPLKVGVKGFADALVAGQEAMKPVTRYNMDLQSDDPFKPDGTYVPGILLTPEGLRTIDYDSTGYKANP